jgi:methylamine dehydrogenase light chain
MLNLGLLDKVFERLSRRTAQRISRRNFLALVGASLAGTAVLPVLPVSRKAFAADDVAAQAARDWAKAVEAQTKDERACNYWRLCSSDGYLCSCCGGGPSTCPPGSVPSPTSWIGSCLNPDDNKLYLIAYRDCCGKDSCGRCPCLGTAGEMPAYRPQLNNDIIWCFGASSMVYHCSSAALIGEV